MVKYLLAAAALVVAGVPAVLGAAGNASFAQDVPVRVPPRTTVPIPQHTGRPAPGDDGGMHQGGSAVGRHGSDH